MRNAGGAHYWKLPDDVRGEAEFSEDGECRYSLTRVWPPEPPLRDRLCAFVGLNPSMATAYADDPTVRFCWLRAREWKYDRFVMLNLFAYRDTSPARMRRAGQAGVDLVADNDRHLADWAHAANASGGIVVAAWGVVPAADSARVDQVSSILGKHGPIYCLDITQDGHPRHPRGVRRDTTPRRWRDSG